MSKFRYDHANRKPCFRNQRLSYEEKLEVLDALLPELDKRDSEVDQIWVTEAFKRCEAYKNGEFQTVSYQELMAKYR